MIPKKHINNYFEDNQQAKYDLWKLIDDCKKIVDKELNPEGYNIGINCGEVAGQTIMHLHFISFLGIRGI